MTGAFLAIAVCLGALAGLLALLRQDRVSLGLPVAYMILLLLNHLPGAYAYGVTGGIYGGQPVLVGISLTALGAVCFLVGAIIARRLMPAKATPSPRTPIQQNSSRFWIFCLAGGWLFVYALTPLSAIPSLGAVIEQGGAIWMLGVMLGLAYAVYRRDVRKIGLWLGALAVYPILMLLLGGFLSYGSIACIIVLSLLAITARRLGRVFLVISVGTYVAISVFVNYFAMRNELRQAVWGGASMDTRLEIVFRGLANFKWFTGNNPLHLVAIDARLNQNYFVGVAAERLRLGQVDFLYGRSIWEGVISLIPRALWPDKPVGGGSGTIVADMTGLYLNANTSWGVGNVMEFYINFGVAGLMIGFLILGAGLTALDERAARSISQGDLGRSFLFFLPAVALIQPLGSMVELSSGAAAALVIAFFWRWAWRRWSSRRRTRPMVAGRAPLRS